MNKMWLLYFSTVNTGCHSLRAIESETLLPVLVKQKPKALARKRGLVYILMLSHTLPKPRCPFTVLTCMFWQKDSCYPIHNPTRAQALYDSSSLEGTTNGGRKSKMCEAACSLIIRSSSMAFLTRISGSRSKIPKRLD